MALKYTTIQLVPWKWDGFVVIGGTHEEVRAFATRELHADLSIGPHACGHAYLEDGKGWLLWVDSLENVPTLAHEALHVTSGVLEARGLTLTGESEEAYTYTMEDLLRQVFMARWKRA